MVARTNREIGFTQETEERNRKIERLDTAVVARGGRGTEERDDSSLCLRQLH